MKSLLWSIICIVLIWTGVILGMEVLSYIIRGGYNFVLSMLSGA